MRCDKSLLEGFIPITGVIDMPDMPVLKLYTPERF
jgi:hypothetical protein